MRIMKKTIIILPLLIALLIIPLASAKYISLQTTLEAELNETTENGTNGTITLTITNIGDESAYDIAPKIKINEKVFSGSQMQSLEINNPHIWRIPFEFSAESEGTYTVVADVVYHDANKYKFSLKSLNTLNYKKSTLSEISGSIKTDLRKKSGKLYINNEGITKKNLKISFEAPDELKINNKIKNKSLDIVIDKDSKQEIDFEINSVSALQGSTYNIYAIIEYEKNSIHYSDFISGAVKVAEKNKFFENIYLIMLITAIFIIGIISYFADIKKNILDAAVLILITIFLLTYFKPNLIFLKTITAGGDTASHYYTAEYMKNYLLPHLKISGWAMGNYAGFPILQFYFPIPFLLMSILSWFIPLQISFKIITILGTFLLPFAVYFMLRLLEFDFPIPSLGAIFTLPFLFNEANSMWGGNIPSTLAGEFSHSLSISLSILFFGTIYYGIKEKKSLWKNIFLFSLVGLTHIYSIFIVVLSSILLLTKDFKKRFVYLLKLYSISFIIMASWMIPLIMFVAYTTPYNISWQFESFFEVVPKILMPFFILSMVGIAYVIITYKNQTKTYYILAPLFWSAILFFSASIIGLVDVRFLSFIYLWCTIMASIGIYYFIKDFKDKIKSLVLFILFISVIILVIQNVSFTPQWIKWNYEGFEKKQTWNTFNEINKFLKGDINNPRVAYEHSTMHNAFGTERAFESLPLFAGRSALEGLYMQSSVSSPFIFYIQSEISKQQSCPFWNNYPCTQMDIKRGTEHLKMFNVGNFIAVSDEAKKAASNNTEYELVKSVENYNIYKLKYNENKYAVPLKYEPILVKISDWKKLSYKWFTKGDISVNLVFVDKITEKEKNYFKIVTNDKGIDINNLKHIEVKSCNAESELFNEEIKIKTDCINKPLLIKVSYHPNWKAEGADKIYLVSPSFMLIYPQKENVRLYY